MQGKTATSANKDNFAKGLPSQRFATKTQNLSGS